MAIDVIFWDFGGVIVKDNVRQAFEGCKVPYDQRARALWKRLRLGQIDHDEFYQQVFHGTSYAHLERDVRAKADELIELQPDGALPVIQQLASCRRYRQGAISNHSKRWGRHIVERWQLDRLLDPIIISAEVGLDKSSCDIFNHAMQRVATPAERILFVDNDPENVCRAQATGMQGICFVGQAELKGALSSYGIRL